MSRPLLEFCLLFIAGVYLGSFLPLPVELPIFLAAVLLFLSAWCYLTDKYYTQRVMALTLLVIGLAAIGLHNANSGTMLTQYEGETVILCGELVAEPDVRQDKVFYLLEARQIQVKEKSSEAYGLVRLTLYHTENTYTYGDLIQVKGKISTVDSPGNPGQFDYRRYLERRGIRVVMQVWQEQDIQKIGIGHRPGWKQLAFAAKERLQAVIDSTLAEEQAALVKGMLFGTRGMISQQVNTDFQITSLVHVLSVSGFHVGLVLAGFLALARLLRLPLPWEAPLGTLVLFFYAVMTGMGPPIIRATVMGVIALWARRLGRERDWPTAMALAAAVILLYDPWALWEPGFQLSFVVTAALLHLTPMVEKMLPPWPRGLRLTTAIVLVAELTAAPLVCYHYNMVSLVGTLTNILATPLISAVMLLSGMAVIAGVFFLPLAAIINVSTGALVDLLLWLVHSMASLPHAAIFLPTPPWPLLICYYLFLALLPRIIYSKEFLKAAKSKLPVVAAAFLLLISFWLFADRQPTLTVHFIDVGQGDAALLQTPGGKNMLIDTGGWSGEFQKGSGAGSQVVLPYLQRLGVNTLDVLLLSHPHEDHAGGAMAIIQRLPVKLAVVSPLKVNHLNDNEPLDEGYLQILAELKGRGVRTEEAYAGQTLKLDDQLEIEILSPADLPDNLNNRSLVLKVTYRKCSFLFTGDIEKEQQQALAEKKVNLKSEVLKVPHHGSGDFAADFLKEVDPSVAVISVGKNNSFGHPADTLIEFLEQMDVYIYRTDLHGAVIVTTDGRSVWVDTGRESKR